MGSLALCDIDPIAQKRLIQLLLWWYSSVANFLRHPQIYEYGNINVWVELLMNQQWVDGDLRPHDVHVT